MVGQPTIFITAQHSVRGMYLAIYRDENCEHDAVQRWSE